MHFNSWSDILDLSSMNFIFILKKEHCDKYGFDTKIKNVIKNINRNISLEIIKLNYLTEGAACTVLKSKNIINTNTPLLIANSDQVIDWSVDLFIKSINDIEADGSILVFHNTKNS